MCTGEKANSRNQKIISGITCDHGRLAKWQYVIHGIRSILAGMEQTWFTR